jgi:hypothetical protein
MATDEGGKKQDSDSQPTIGFQFNGPVTGQNQTFISGNVGSINQGISPDDLLKLDKVFQPFREQVEQIAPADKKDQADEKVQALQAELSKGENANTERLNSIIDGLLDLVPGAVSAVGTMFASPLLAALVGPATKLVLDHIK